MKTVIHTPTPSLEKSLDFYHRLNFQRIGHPEHHLVSDGKCLILINPDRYARAGLQLHQDSWEVPVSKLKKITEVTATEHGYLLADPSGVMLYLLENDLDTGKEWRKSQPSHLGKFAGLSLETADMARSAMVWEMLGFTQSMGSVEQGWVGFQNDENFTVSFMRPNTCPHLFFNPSLTYFNGKANLEVIEKVRKAGIPITEEITHFNKEGLVDNIVIRDPGGYGFFLFND